MAQEAKLKLSFIGYKETYQEAVLSFSNIGQVTLTDITIFVDGEERQTIKTTLPPGRTFKFDISLDQGGHLVEAKTPEGGHSDVEILIVGSGQVSTPVEVTVPQTEHEGFSIITFEGLVGIFALLILFLMAVLWLKEKRKR